MLGSLVLLTTLLGLTAIVSASEYDPPGLYDVEYLRLSNGVDVVLKKRTQAHNVAVRFAVNVGSRNFPCDKRETAHFLEHLLFMGTSRHSETELTRTIQDHGGYWNAYTAMTETVYQVDIFDKHFPVAIDTLHEIMADTIITPQTIESARAVIYRERSGKLSSLVRWLYANGVMKPAIAKASEALVPGTGVVCPGVISPEGIEEADVRGAYESYYVPSNMTLVVIGNFDRDSLVEQIRNTFGKLPSKPSNGNGVVTTPPYPTVAQTVTGTLAPLVGTDATIGFAYRTDGSNSVDHYPLWVAWKYLERQLYERIRVEKALSYSPTSAYSAVADYGAFVIGTDVNLDRIEAAKSLLEQEIENVREGRIKAEELEAAKRRILLERVQGYESNRDLAVYYVASRFQLRTTGKLTSHEDAIAGVTVDEVQRAAQKYLGADHRITFVTTPTLTYNQFFVGLGLLIVGVPGSGFYLIRRFIKKRGIGNCKTNHDEAKAPVNLAEGIKTGQTGCESPE
jgi:predicted Zn-dependent peptidase